MSFTLQHLVYLCIAYLIAAIPFGLVVSKIVTGRDVRKQGSGNIGATNVARTMGKKWGILVLFLDALKGYIVVKEAWMFGTFFFVNLVVLVAVLGHCFPIYLKFKGGKGVATALGSLAALSWTLVGILFGVFLIAVILTRRISVGSLAAALALPLVVMIFRPYVLIPFAWSITLIIWWKHRENLKRIWRNQEPKFF